MDYKTCSNCRNTNVPNANVCTNCGNVLEQTQNMGQEPPPTIISNQPQIAIPPPPKEAKKSRKVFWIVGIVGVLLVIGIGLLGIIGIGGYLYFANQEPVVEREYPGRPPVKDAPPKTDDGKGDEDSPLSDIEFPAASGDDGLNDNKSNTAGKITNDQLKAFFRVKKSNIKGFRLQSVVENFDKSLFSNRNAGVKARYKKGSTRLTHNFAAYGSNSELKEDFDEYKQKVKSSGGKISKTTATSVIYIKGRLVYFAFYNPQGGFHEMSSRNGKDILKYHNAYFGIKK